MEKKTQLVVKCNVKHVFRISLIIFFMVGAVAFYFVNLVKQGIITSTEQAATTRTSNVYDLVDGCDLFSGKWVHDNESYPLYKELQCPYIQTEFACGRYGRMDSKYLQWRWQPHSCNLPRFDAKEVLERLRGKRVLFVGDSINRNQWVSMVCMLQTLIPLEFREMQNFPLGAFMTFKALEYNLSVEFYWAPMLVESNGDHPFKHKTQSRIVRLKSIKKHGKNWVNADVLVFNSYIWWMTKPTVKILNGSLDDPAQYNLVDNHKGYSMVMKEWSNWLHNHVNHSRTQLYFMSMTATHNSGTEWGMTGGHKCFNETEPVKKDGFWGRETNLKLMRILESSLNKLRKRGVNVKVVNITQLTQYRKDGHPSIYRSFNYPLTTTQLTNPPSYADCTHWCVPGVPDVWNELLLAYILQGRK